MRTNPSVVTRRGMNQVSGKVIFVFLFFFYCQGAVYCRNNNEAPHFCCRGLGQNLPFWNKGASLVPLTTKCVFERTW
jgi:hypothetical protein